MSNPWDLPPFPKRGDTNEDHTYLQVGKVVSNWEATEFNLARLYTVFVRDIDGQSLQDYGKNGRIFRERLAGLTKAAEEHFTRRPNQEAEGLFQKIVVHVTGFADRRNDVAHGVVLPVNRLAAITQHFMPGILDQKQWALIPPYHAIRQHDASGPLYVYTSVELRSLADSLVLLSVGIDDFRNGLLPVHMRRLVPRPLSPLPEK